MFSLPGTVLARALLLVPRETGGCPLVLLANLRDASVEDILGVNQQVGGLHLLPISAFHKDKK